MCFKIVLHDCRLEITILRSCAISTTSWEQRLLHGFLLPGQMWATCMGSPWNLPLKEDLVHMAALVVTFGNLLTCLVCPVLDSHPIAAWAPGRTKSWPMWPLQQWLLGTFWGTLHSSLAWRKTLIPSSQYKTYGPLLSHVKPYVNQTCTYDKLS